MLVLVNLIGFGLALLVTSKIRTRNILRSIYFMPNLIGGLILGFIWQFIFSKLLTQIGDVTGLESIFFNLADHTTTAFWSLVIVGVWQQAGYVMIIYIAGLQSIPHDVMEASQIDGASRVKQLFRITIPLMIPSFTINMFVTLSNALKQYDTNLSLTNGGPYGSTEMVAMNILQTAYKYNHFAQAQAKAILFFLVIMIVTLFQVNFDQEEGSGFVKSNRLERHRLTGLTLLGWILSLAILGPVYILVVNSFKSRKQIFADQLGWPESFDFQYYINAAKQMNYFNSLKIPCWSLESASYSLSFLLPWLPGRWNAEGPGLPSICFSCSFP